MQRNRGGEQQVCLGTSSSGWLERDAEGEEGGGGGGGEEEEREMMREEVGEASEPRLWGLGGSALLEELSGALVYSGRDFYPLQSHLKVSLCHNIAR